MIILKAYLHLPGGSLWFVLSQVANDAPPAAQSGPHSHLSARMRQESLSYFETEHSLEPLGCVRVDEISSVQGALQFVRMDGLVDRTVQSWSPTGPCVHPAMHSALRRSEQAWTA